MNCPKCGKPMVRAEFQRIAPFRKKHIIVLEECEKCGIQSNGTDYFGIDDIIRKSVESYIDRMVDRYFNNPSSKNASFKEVSEPIDCPIQQAAADLWCPLARVTCTGEKVPPECPLRSGPLMVKLKG